ncbi:MAG TPA: hypothetical protein VMH23_14415 [Bacteroidota bacterium]|nr:hypothetical protein [Bacteroidota bacterium]
MNILSRACARGSSALLLGLCAQQFVFAQASSSNSALDVTFEPRSVSLGEATVALPGSRDAFTSNPASLSGLSGAWISYDHRGMEWTKSFGHDDMRYRSWSLGAATPIGTFLIEYRRQDYGEFEVTTVESPDGAGTAAVYNHVFGVAWGKSFGSWISVGAAIKSFTDVETVTGSPAASLQSLQTQPAYLLDIGVLAQSGSVLRLPGLKDNFSVGASLQNFGTDYRMTGQGIPGQIENEYYVPLPRALHLGIAYEFAVSGAAEHDADILKATVVGEYRTVLNSFPSQHDYHWGWGLELTTYDIFSVRLGGYLQPYESVYGRDRVFAIRYGAGLHLPWSLVAKDALPLAFCVDYAAIPLYSVDVFTYWSSPVPATANVFTVRLQYEADIFGGGQ